MHETLAVLYDEMMPLCSQMSGIARAVAGMGALLNISLRIWRTLADGSQIEILPLLRPFGTGLLIAFFPTLVLGTLNGILGAVSAGAEAMLSGETFSVTQFRQELDVLERQRLAQDPETAYMESDEAFDKELESLGWSPSDLTQMTKMFAESALYNFKVKVREMLAETMEFVFESSSLIIDTLRTFYLVVLSILGPISFSLSVWNGLESTMGYWLSRYIQIYLWLPVSEIFSCILARLESLILQNGISSLQSGGEGVSSWTYLLFMAVGTVGYFCVPTVSQWIVQAGGVGAYGRIVNISSRNTAALPGKAYQAIKNRNGTEES